MSLDRLLVIDESAAVRTRIADTARERGFDAREASSPEEAEAALRDAPVVVFTELLGDPSEAIERVVADMQRLPRSAFVLVTVEPPESEHVRRAIRMGAFDVLHKPVRREDVRRVLDDLDAEAGELVHLR